MLRLPCDGGPNCENLITGIDRHWKSCVLLLCMTANLVHLLRDQDGFHTLVQLRDNRAAENLEKRPLMISATIHVAHRWPSIAKLICHGVSLDQETWDNVLQMTSAYELHELRVNCPARVNR